MWVWEDEAVKGHTRATTLPEDGPGRKQHPVASGVMDYFPDALVAISRVSHQGNEQHNPGQPLHWDRSKSTDEADTMLRHFLQRGTIDTDGTRHSAKMAWRALALLQKEIEAEQQPKALTIIEEAPAQMLVCREAHRCPQDGQPNCCPGNEKSHQECLEIAAGKKGSYLNTGHVSY